MSDAAERPGERGGLWAWLWRDLPYAAMLAFALGGLVLASFRGAGTYYYWMAMAPVYGLIAIATGWRRLDTGNERLQLALTQVLHWFGILAAMWLMFLPQVRGIENDNATSLSLLILLALGTFLAGVHARVWRVCIVGAFLAVAVPAVAWIQESVILLLVVVLLVAVVVLGFWWLRHRGG
ncbi:MAG: hypothetical protein JOY64_15485 [Alphaproteobacteria bacterium]|nr:hypothetical protein [Alphaproteobacteria bacterium]MBV8409033.1 hypothetical protein [Alphaproteobacteria bacterium]